MTRTHLLVVAKSPVPGRVKTRLCPPCTPQEAAALAEAALADTLDAVTTCGADRRILALEGPPGPWLPPGFEVVPQATGGLDRRLAAAWSFAGGPGVQIGMDTPQVTADLLVRCAERLEFGGPGTAVLGTAPDGGWWALGLHSADGAAVLADVPMSRDDTAVRTREALEAIGLLVLDLPELTDIDHFPDALAVAAQCPPDSRTARVVTSVAAAVGSPA